MIMHLYQIVVAESYQSRLEVEFLKGSVFRSLEDARIEMFDYIGSYHILIELKQFEQIKFESELAYLTKLSHICRL